MASGFSLRGTQFGHNGRHGKGSIGGLWCAVLLLLLLLWWWAGLGNRTNSVAENRHLLSIACNSRSSRTALVQGYRSTATSPVFPPLYAHSSVRPDKYGMASYAVRRQSRELAAAVASCSAGSCRGNSHLPTTLQPWLGRGGARYQELESEEYLDYLPWPPWFPTPMSPLTPVEMLISGQEAVDQDLDPKPGSRRQMPSLSLRVRSALLMLRLHAIRSRVPPMLELVLLAKPTCGFSEPSMRRFRNGACRAKPPSTRP